MYLRFYGLREPPFELTPNPKFLFLTPRHREALSNLEYGLSAAKSLTVLVGEAGTGKTTLLHAALESERCQHVRCVYLNNPALTREDFVRTLAARFELSPKAAESKAVFLDELERVLRERRSGQQEVTALVVDEAQNLSAELLEELRLLANIETRTERLLPLVLAGQPEFAVRLDDAGLRQLKQRVALRCEIAAFDLAETATYIASRIRTAGGDASKMFTRDAVMLIHQYSGGIPRTVSVLCDNALVSGMALGRYSIDRGIITEVARDFGFYRADDGAAVSPSAEVHVSGDPAPAPDAAPEDAAAADALAGAPRRKRFGFFRWSGRSAVQKASAVGAE